jgi:hypothetical protein
MTTRIGTGGPGTGVTATASAARVTAAPGQPFKAMMSAGKNAILSGAESAVTRLPGGPILAAALRPSAGDVGPAQTSATGAGGLSGPGGVGSSTPEGTAGTAGLGSGAGGGATASAENGGVEAALNQSANQNLYFIEIQERISAESRSYSAISNVLKARHDTVKNAIGNIR